MHIHPQRDRQARTAPGTDKGFTLVELLIVIVILGILATVTVFAVRGITNKGNSSACNTDKSTIQTAAEAYFAQYGTSTIATSTYAAGGGTGVAFLAAGSPAPIPAVTTAIAVPTTSPAVAWSAGANPAATLFNAGFLRTVPTNFFLRPDGTLVTVNGTCGTIGAIS